MSNDAELDLITDRPSNVIDNIMDRVPLCDAARLSSGSLYGGYSQISDIGIVLSAEVSTNATPLLRRRVADDEMGPKFLFAVTTKDENDLDNGKQRFNFREGEGLSLALACARKAVASEYYF